MSDIEKIQTLVLPRFPGCDCATVEPLGNGLINQTFLVQTCGRRCVLQRVSPIFSPLIHDNIAAVTRALSHAGLITPMLIDAVDGKPWVDLGADGVWRMQTFITGCSFDKVRSLEQAFTASALVARFHKAVDTMTHRFVGMREGVHDTAKHLTRLEQTVAAHAGHRLADQVDSIAELIFHRARTLPPLPDLAPRICHGDLKLNNVLFEGAAPPASDRAVCLIDLDTVGPMSLAYELGDAWRSWCNRSGEDASRAVVDMDVMRASFQGYQAALERPLGADERMALLLGPEWVSLELASRFAADALNEQYFGWDPQRYPSRGEHNLVRARGQLALHEAFVASRKERLAIVGAAAID